MYPRKAGSAVLLWALIAGCTGSDPGTATTLMPAEKPWFEDVTAQLGLNHTHDCGPITPEFFMPQIMGSGCAFLDFDGDGRLDIYLINNGGPKGANNQLFHQEKDGVFRNVSAGSGLDVAGYGQGVAVADVNNDGLPDVLLTEYGATRLFLNLGGGKFKEITHEAGLDNALWATSAAFFDFDRDGWLDLVVVNYVDYDKSIRCPSASGKADYCGPNMFDGTVARLYRNLGAKAGPGGVRFEDVTVQAGLAMAKGKGLGVLCCDFNGDGWPDIFVANDMIANFLWINQRDGTFKEEGIIRGVAYTLPGVAAANMGIALADISGSGSADLFVTHLVDETHTLWRQGPRGFFRDQTRHTRLSEGRRSTAFGTAFVDFDRDGWPDLVYVNGAVRMNSDAPHQGPFWGRYAQRHQLFANRGKGRFTEISEHNPALCGEAAMGRGLAVGDFDNDGAPDLLVTQVGGPVKLFRNVAPANGHWLGVRAILPREKRDAYGAEIKVWAGGRSFWRLLNPGSSYCSSHDPRCHFGLGAAQQYDAIDVLWPDGTEETFVGGVADRYMDLRQGDGKLKRKSDSK